MTITEQYKTGLYVCQLSELVQDSIVNALKDKGLDSNEIEMGMNGRLKELDGLININQFI